VLYEQAQQILRRDGAERSTFTSSATVSLSVSLGQPETAKNEPVPSQSPFPPPPLFPLTTLFSFFFSPPTVGSSSLLGLEQVLRHGRPNCHLLGREEKRREKEPRKVAPG
jgi:hypothetical protein